VEEVAAEAVEAEVAEEEEVAEEVVVLLHYLNHKTHSSHVVL
jgi:hypothetical protein